VGGAGVIVLGEHFLHGLRVHCLRTVHLGSFGGDNNVVWSFEQCVCFRLLFYEMRQTLACLFSLRRNLRRRAVS